MPAPASSTERVQFGVFELDLQRAELRKQGVKVKLQEQPLKVLQVLLENPGQIVSRDELRQRVWPANTFVEFDQGLYGAAAGRARRLGGQSEIYRDGGASRISVHCASRRRQATSETETRAFERTSYSAWNL
jgi:hypothetical protein